MAKPPIKVEAGHGEAGLVETADPATPSAAAPAESSSKHVIPNTIVPLRAPTLSELNNSAYLAHQEDADFKKRKALAATKAMEAVLRRVN